MRSSRLLTPVLAALCLLPGLAGSAQAATPVGFQTDLAGDVHIECSLFKGALTCLDYSRSSAPGRCSFGGDVPGLVLKRTGKAKKTHACVDEGFHGWKYLSAGKTYQRGGFKCRVRKDASVLSCTNRTRKVTMATGSAPATEPTPDANPGAVSCPDIVFAPNSEDSASEIKAAGTACEAASVLIGDVRASHNFTEGPRSFASGDYSCTVVSDETALPVGYYTCTAATATVTWTKH